MKRWLKLTLITEPVLAEPIADFFVGIIDAGVEIGVDDSHGVKTVTAYVEKENPTTEETERILLQVQSHVAELAAIFGIDSPKITWEVIEEEDWSKNWKEHFTPFKVAEGLVIAPTWEKYSPADREKVIVMDPGMAFGTGHHATTSLVLDLLGQVIATNDGEHTVLDVGTGTGILGMAAALFGARCVYAIDNDPVAVAAAVKNIQQNGLAAVMRADETPLEM
ncbi:MAG TPA: 50S ribosomal protein L11 methyltransferase, partial [Desulfopila sp.]|nr:50S ribosomal protein L11 methyltransferase [Desulfopila sp.]